MALAKIIADLERLERPDRGLDQSIALQVGYTLSIDQGLLAGEKDQKVWWFGSPPKEVELPAFTKNLDDALILGELVSPERDGDVGETSTAAIPMCIAAMKELQKRKTSSRNSLVSPG